MDYLYVLAFDNGHIKVGRSTQPDVRMKQHAQHVACMGVTLADNWIVEAGECASGAEALLINQCAARATRTHKREWFEGLDFQEVLQWAKGFANAPALVVVPVNAERPDFRAIAGALKGQGLTQAELGQHCGCDQSSISDIATGKVTDPRYSVGAALVALYNAET